MESIQSLLEHYLIDTIGDGVVQVAGTLVFIGLIWLMMDSFDLSRRISILYANVSIGNFTVLSNKFPSVTLPPEIFPFMTSRQLNGIQYNNQVVPLPVGSAILPFNIIRSSVQFTKNDGGSEDLQLTDLSFELDTLIPAAVEVYCGVQMAALDKHSIVRQTTRSQTTTAIAATNPIATAPAVVATGGGAASVSSRNETSNLLGRGLTGMIRGQLPAADGVSDENIALRQIKRIHGLGYFEEDSSLCREEALFAMKRVNLPAAMRQQVSIKKLPIIDQKRMASVYRRHLNSIKSEALLRSNSQEAMSLLEEGNHDLLIKHLAAQSKLLSSSPRSLIPFVIIVRASKPLDLISPATVNIRAGDYAGEIDLSKSAAWFLIFGRQPQTHAAVEQPAVVSASDSSSGAAGSLNRVTPVVEEQQKTQQLQSPAAAVESSSSDQKLSSTTTFRMEHLTQLAYIPNPRIPPPETYKWFDCEELFGTTSTSKQNLADAEKQNNKNSSDEEPVESPHHSTTSLSENINEALQCCVCLSDPATIMMLPCRHVCMCFDCFRGMEEDEGTETAGSQADRMKRDWEAAESCEYVQVNVSCNQCPVCRSKVKAWVEISK